MNDLHERKVESRDKKDIKIVNIEFDRINNNFENSIKEIKDRQKKLKRKKNLKDEDYFILRTQIVFLESAFDYYIHEIITYGIIKIYNGEWETNNDFESILIKLNTCINMLKKPELSAEILKEYIIEFFSGMTFLDKKNLNSKLKIIGISSQNISSILYPNESEEGRKQKFAQFFTELYHRRNRIVHQCDMEFGSNSKCDINIGEVDNFINTIEKIIVTIKDLIEKKDNSN